MPQPWHTQGVVLRFENSLFPITSDKHWEALFPSNYGKIHLDRFPNREFIVAMYQQLHCLDVVRVAFLQLHASPSHTKVANFTEADDCMDQLLQTILCHGDISLEPAVLVLNDGKFVPGSKGVGVDHRCRDWNELRAQMA